MNKGTAIVGFILCFLAGVGLMWGVDRGGRSGVQPSAEHGRVQGIFPEGPWSDEEASIPVSSKDPNWGARTAPVTIVIFSDFQCPYCKDAEEGTIAAMKEKYGPEKLRLVWKQNPLPMHSKATPAAVASQVVFRVAGSEAFWKWNESAFANNRDLTPENFESWAADAGVDSAKFKAGMADSKGDQEKVAQDLELGKRSGVRGTPAFFINGVFINGNQGEAVFTQEIEKQLKAAEQALAAGTKADQLYVKLTNQNKPKDTSATPQPPQPPPTPPQPPKKPQQDTTTVWKVVAPDSAPSRMAGPEPWKKVEALVTIIEVSDFECAYCGKVEPTVKKILETEKYAGKVKLVWVDNPVPFHKLAEPAAHFAFEANAQKGALGFWAAHDLLFAHQTALGDLDKYATELADLEVTIDGKKQKLGVDPAKMKEAVAKRRYAEKLFANQVLADDVQAAGTPHFFINGRRIMGAEELETFTKVIDEELARATTLAKEAKPGELYKELIKNGKPAPAFEATLEKKDVGALPKDAPSRGSDKATVVIQEFSEFEDPYCARSATTMTQLLDTYGDKVKLVWRHKPLPVHKLATGAAIAAQAVYEQKGSKGFWAFHDLLFQNQKQLDADSLKKFAGELTLDGKPAGIDMAKWSTAIGGEPLKKRIEADLEVSQKAQIASAPAFIIGGYYVSGAQTFIRLRRVVELALKDAATKK